MPALLFPAYQKFYSAISSLERFEKEQNFFDNISCLDNFFAEYRNITFTVQAALKHTEYFSSYEENRNKYLSDHWFVEKRNETTKQKPFPLVKKIDITTYFPDESITLCTQSFTVENDIPMDSLNNDLKNLLKNTSQDEVFFSATFSFFEKDTTVDLWDKLFSGITSMQTFMDVMYHTVGENCILCNQLREKIQHSKLSTIPKDFWLINDYVYYPTQDIFARAQRLVMVICGNKVASKLPLRTLIGSNYFNYDGTTFGTFVFMHALIRIAKPGADIMPAILTVYNDDTYDMDVFHADIKTTIYRKITEVSQLIKSRS